MGQRVTVKIIAPTLIKGEPVEPGPPADPTIIALDAADAQTLIANSKAERFTPVAEPGPEIMAAALAQAKTELLERIEAADTIADLDALLSEDPDVVAAYEKRLAELAGDGKL